MLFCFKRCSGILTYVYYKLFSEFSIFEYLASFQLFFTMINYAAVANFVLRYVSIFGHATSGHILRIGFAELKGKCANSFGKYC